MHTAIRNTLALVVGIVAGSVVNMGLINVSGHIIAPPVGADLTTMEGLEASMHLFGTQHFLFPFLAHALGTLVGALVAGLLAASQRLLLGLMIGALFMAGGIMMVIQLPSPMWFSALDIGVAYLPMGWLGAAWATRIRS